VGSQAHHTTRTSGAQITKRRTGGHVTQYARARKVNFAIVITVRHTLGTMNIALAFASPAAVIGATVNTAAMRDHGRARTYRNWRVQRRARARRQLCYLILRKTNYSVHCSLKALQREQREFRVSRRGQHAPGQRGPLSAASKNLCGSFIDTQASQTCMSTKLHHRSLTVEAQSRTCTPRQGGVASRSPLKRHVIPQLLLFSRCLVPWLGCAPLVYRCRCECG
jgi:hypothetical protein